nr:hypothetical protein [Vibrio cholerae]
MIKIVDRLSNPTTPKVAAHNGVFTPLPAHLIRVSALIDSDHFEVTCLVG